MAAACASPARLRTGSSGSSACAAVTWPPRETTRAARQPFLAALPSAALREKVQSPPRGYHAPDQPMLDEMTDAAIRVLSRNRRGFFLMVEGAHIDKQSHLMDATRRG